MSEAPLYGAVEAGGTKFVCAVGSGPDDLRATTRFDTTTPEETIGQMIAFFQDRQQAGDILAGIGVASFGPVDLIPTSATWGHVTETPKPGWSGADIAGPLGRATGCPIAFDTDVNGAALGEYRWGAGQGCDPVIYVTIGTGIGGGAVVNGKTVHGLVHPEMGHMLVRRDAGADPFPGRCPFHGDCLEGLACGPALIDRWGDGLKDLPEDHAAWTLQADYLGQFCANIALTFSPQRIILGGGVMAQTHLYGKIAARTRDLLAGYIQHPAILERAESYIVPPGLGDRAGIAGAIALAQEVAP